MRRALIIGKFYPPHSGHHYLIDTALEECDEVVVAVCWSKVETISYKDRMAWLKDRHPDARIVECQDENPQDYSDAGWQAHMDVWLEMLHHVRFWPTHVYSSEDYGWELVERLNAAVAPSDTVRSWFVHRNTVCHRSVDQDRVAHPISGSACRENLLANWGYLAPATRAGLTLRVVICGAESSGTTTLTKALAKRYNTVWVPEYGRLMSECLETSPYFEWNNDDFKTIVQEQDRIEDLFARQAGPVMFCDTDLYATAMFHQLYDVGGPLMSHDIETLARLKSVKHPLYIVTDHEGVHFEDDGLRRFENQRQWQTDWFMDHLEPGKTVAVTGSHERRVLTASDYIDDELDHAFRFAQPLEYRVS